MTTGTPQETPWMLLPVEEPVELHMILPEMRHVTLPELDLFTRFNSLYIELNAVRNTAFFAASRLNVEREYDAQLHTSYQQRLQNKTDEIIGEYTALTEEMFNFARQQEEDVDTAVQRLAWITFCQRCIEKFESLRGDLNVDLDNFESLNVWQDRELEALFGRYLNAKYRAYLSTTNEHQ